MTVIADDFVAKKAQVDAPVNLIHPKCYSNDSNFILLWVIVRFKTQVAALKRLPSC